MTSSTKPIYVVSDYATAKHYLTSFAEPNRSQAAEECASLEAYISEIDPASPHSSTLSARRKKVLLERIADLFTTIATKLDPVNSRPSAALQKQWMAIEELVRQLPLPEKQLRKALKNLPSDLQEKVYRAVWLSAGAPLESPLRFGPEKIKADPDILLRRFPPFYALVGGTLLEQIAAVLKMKYQRTHCQENISVLREINSGLRMSIDPEKIKAKLLCLSEEIQDLIFKEATLLAFQANPSSAKPAILADVTLLKGIKNSCLAGSNIIEQLANKQQTDLDQLIQKIKAEKAEAFKACYKECTINRYQMNALFDKMPASIKVQLPHPPYFGRGFNPELYKTLGAHYDKEAKKTTFRVYAPHARDIKLNLTTLQKVERVIPMRKDEEGVWESQTTHAPPGRTYYFSVVGRDGGEAFKKLDPFAFGNVIDKSCPTMESHASVVRIIDTGFVWTDAKWMTNRVNIDPAKTPMAIYEVHPTWKINGNGKPLNWRELGLELGNYCHDMGYTHVQFMALFEHPHPISMGYQITSFFSLNSAMGSIEDFQFLVNHLHQRRKIGVIIDWVSAHFAVDKFSLSNFDGTALFEDDDPNFAMHPHWGTYEFDFKKQYTKNFLSSNLNFFVKTLHLDGVRVDAVQSMLNLNYGRAEGARLNPLGGPENLEAKDFLRNLNTYIRTNYPGVLMIAEEAGGFPNLTRPVTERGIHVKTRGVGFNLTWHMGFMNDSLFYFATPPRQRESRYSVFSGLIQTVDYNEDSRPRGSVVLAYSHDENANGKGTIFTKMAGNSAPDKFANGRLLLAFQSLRGGGPILDFMGNEILQTQEWHGRLIQGLSDPNQKKSTFQWEELDTKNDANKYHIGARECRKALLRLYRENSGLHDQTNAGISWIDATDSTNGVLSFHRRGNGQQFACVFNSSDKDLKDYLIPLPNPSYAPELTKLVSIREIFNTDDMAFGGLGRKNPHIEIIRCNQSDHPSHLKLRLPPFSALLLEEYFT